MLIGINGGYFPAICRVCFCFNFRLVLVLLWRFLETHVNFMIIRRFLMYFADFRANFCVFFWRFFCFAGSNGYWRNALYLRIFMITIGYSFVGKNHFLLRNMTKKWRKLELFFLIFLQFFVFVLFLAKFLCLLWLAFCFVGIWITYWLRGIFLWIYMFLKY